jgi:hypothetical protein
MPDKKRTKQKRAKPQNEPDDIFSVKNLNIYQAKFCIPLQYHTTIIKQLRL